MRPVNFELRNEPDPDVFRRGAACTMGSTGALHARGVGECREHAYGVEWTALRVRVRASGAW